MTYKAKSIANYFIAKALIEGEHLTPIRVMKLVYIAHGWCLVIKNEPLIDEHISAYKYGPIIESLYKEFAPKYGNNFITQLADAPNIYDEDTRALLEKTWDAYDELTAIQLANWCQEPGSPWEQTVRNKYFVKYRNIMIDDAVIKAYFAKI